MSHRRQISWSAITSEMRNNRTKLPAGYLGARSMVECYVRTRRPLVVAGKYDRAAIMAHAAAAAKLHQDGYGSTWGEAMAITLKASWQVAKAAHRAAAH